MFDKSHPFPLPVNMRWTVSILTHGKFKLQIQELGNPPHFLLLFYFPLKIETLFIEEKISRHLRPKFTFSFPMKQTYRVFKIKYGSHWSLFILLLPKSPFGLVHKLSEVHEQCQTILVPSKQKALQNKMHVSLVAPFNRKEVADCKNEIQHS